jgi:hypothetical protein
MISSTIGPIVPELLYRGTTKLRAGADTVKSTPINASGSRGPASGVYT